MEDIVLLPETLLNTKDQHVCYSSQCGIVKLPLSPVLEGYSDFKVITSVIDYGYRLDWSSNFGTMELYSARVIPLDPSNFAGTLKGKCKQLPQLV